MPLWQEVEHIDPRHHVLHLALPAPGSDEQLHELIADLHAPMLERHRPGWKIYVIEGLAGGRFAIYHKVHHALVDGESGMAILRRSLAESPRDRRIRTTVGLEHPQRPRPAPHGLRATLEREAQKLARTTLTVGRSSFQIAEEALEGLLGYSPLRKRAFTAPQTPMNEPIWNARAIAHTALPLAAHEGRGPCRRRDAERRRAVHPRRGHPSLPARDGPRPGPPAGRDLPGVAARSAGEAGDHQRVGDLAAARPGVGADPAPPRGGQGQHPRREGAAARVSARMRRMPTR